jgi:hypothetical protein
VAPLREEGIQKPAGGRPQGGGDEEEDAIKIVSMRINKEFNICI